MPPDSIVQGNWQSFLHVSENKEELCQFLAIESATKVKEGTFITARGTIVLSNSDDDLSLLSPCTQEEADTRMFLHAFHAARSGSKRTTICMFDTDAAVLGIGLFQQLELEELWLSFGDGQYHCYISIHEIVEALGGNKS